MQELCPLSRCHAPTLGCHDTVAGVFDNDAAGTPTRAQVDRAMAQVMLPSLMHREGGHRLPAGR